MKKRILTFIIVLASVFMLASCEQKDQSEALTGQTVTLRLSGVEIPGARTIRPDTVKSAESYKVSLTEVSMNESGSYVPVQNSPNNKNDINAKISTDGSALTLTITDVHIGSYQVTVNGFTDNVRVLSGKSKDSAPLVVSPSGGNSVTITLEQVYSNEGSENLTGTVSIPIDWSAVTSERIINGFQLIVFDDDSNDTNKIASYTYNPAEGEKTSDTFTFQADVTPSRFVRFDLYNSDGIEFISTLRRTYIWVAAGNESKPMDGEKGIVINDMNLQPAFNIYNLKAEEKDPTSATLTWNNFGNGQLEKVNFWYTTEDSKPEEVTFTVRSGLDGNDASCELKNLETGKEYKLWYQAVYKNGMVSSIDQYQGTIKTMVYVTSIEITAEESIKTAVNEKFNLSVEITPDNATDKTYTWDYDEEYFSVSGDQFTARKAGVKTITVKANGATDGTEITDSIEIKTHLQTPVLKAEATAQGIELTGYQVDDAQSYDIYRDDKLLIESTTATTYLDKDVKTSENYSYYVIAKLTKNEVNLDSAQSNKTAPVSIEDCVINITIPEIEEGFDIVLADTASLYLMHGEKEEITVSYEPPEGYTLTWKLEDKKLTPDNPEGTKITINITNLIAHSTPLTLSLTKDGQSYSNSINVYVITALDTGVKVEIADTEYTEGSAPYRVSSNSTYATSDTPAQARQLQLNATAIDDNGNKATIEDVFFEIAEESPEGIATIDDNGLITFTAGAYTTDNNPLVVNVWSTNSKDKPMKVKFDVYYATVESAVQIVNAINTEWAKHFSSADSSSHFDGDWGATTLSENTYKSSGFFFQRAVNSISDGAAYGTISNASIALNNITGNIITVNSNGNINFSLYDHPWDGKGSVLGTEDLKTISCNSQSLSVELPFNQGTATITYESIRVKDDSGKNTRGGYYSVDFSSEILGVNGENFDRTGNNKINDTTEATNITKLIYG